MRGTPPIDVNRAHGYPQTMAGRSAPKGAPTPIERVRAICLALPEAVEKPFGGHTAPSFRVRDKLFVMTSEDGSSLTMKADKGENTTLVEANPETFFLPKYVASKGWVGIRLGPRLDWAEVEELIIDSYRLIAPARLAKRIDA